MREELNGMMECAFNNKGKTLFFGGVAAASLALNLYYAAQNDNDLRAVSIFGAVFSGGVFTTSYGLLLKKYCELRNAVREIFPDDISAETLSVGSDLDVEEAAEKEEAGDLSGADLPGAVNREAESGAGEGASWQIRSTRAGVGAELG